MNPFKKHYEILTVLGSTFVGIILACVWLNSQFFYIHERINCVEKELVKIQTVLICQGLMHKEMMMSMADKKIEPTGKDKN